MTGHDQAVRTKRRGLRRGGLLLLATLTLTLTENAPAQTPSPDLEIKLEADSSDIDRKNNRLVFYNVRVTQGPIDIRADRADGSGLEFENTDWVFSGNVRISSDTTRIEADEAELSFVDHKLRHAVVKGSPVAFQHERPAADAPTEGRANQVDFDFDTQVLRLSGDAWLAEGTNQISGEHILYDITRERVLAGSNGESDERVRITITPPRDEDNLAPEPGPDDTPPPGP